MTIKQKLTQKTIRIEEIKDTLKKTQLMTRQLKDGTIVPDTEVIDEVVKEYEGLEDEEDPTQDDEDEEDNDGLDDEEDNEDEDDDGMDNGLEEIDPQILKL